MTQLSRIVDANLVHYDEFTNGRRECHFPPVINIQQAFCRVYTHINFGDAMLQPNLPDTQDFVDFYRDLINGTAI